jgi:hypothetical protein
LRNVDPPRFFTETIDGNPHAMMVRGSNYAADDDPNGPGYRDGGSTSYKQVTLGPDEYWMMGDNRDGSEDSRAMRSKWNVVVTRDRIVGKATGIVWSLDKRYKLWPRWDRFFHSLP